MIGDPSWISRSLRRRQRITTLILLAASFLKLSVLTLSAVVVAFSGIKSSLAFAETFRTNGRATRVLGTDMLFALFDLVLADACFEAITSKRSAKG